MQLFGNTQVHPSQIRISEAPWSEDWKKVVSELRSDPRQGLSENEAAARRAHFGKNTLPEEKPLSRPIIFLRQFRSPLIFILLIAGLGTLLFRHFADSLVIFGALLLNTWVGYFQENKATRSLLELKNILKKKALVIREDKEKEILQEEIVPGDVILLNPGATVPADSRIIECWQLEINEAVLTGEWMASEKLYQILPEKTSLAERTNMVYMGTVIAHGTAKAVATSTGSFTELGKIAKLLEKIKEEKTPYQKKLLKFSWTIGLVIGSLALAIFFVGALGAAVLDIQTVIELFTVAIAIAVAGIPEGLPVAMTIVLAIGMQRILAQRGLVRHLPAAETLGSTTVIATDKTLTLTQGNMEVEEIFTLQPAFREETLRCAALANEAFIENPEAVFEEWTIRGRPTDQALIKAAIEAGVSKSVLEKELPAVFRLPFDSERKYIVSFHQKKESGLRAYLAGAPEIIVTLARLPETQKSTLNGKLQELAGRGLRVVGFAFKDFPDLNAQEIAKKEDWHRDSHLYQLIKDIRFLGFIALKDPLRPDAKQAIRLAQDAGLKIIVVTGDHLLTAKAVAKELGLDGKEGSIIEGKELDAMSDEELQTRLADIEVYARVEPHHKLRIIEAWQDKGEVIAMTGDGVNDAPALKKADIGVALGSGTDVAKESSDLILLDDNFSIIPAAIKEGRVIIDNIRKLATYLLSGSFTETILIGTSMLVGAPFLPVTALQILWINLVEDGLPGIALTAERAEEDVMRRKPQKKDAPLLTAEMRAIIFFIGIFTDLLLLVLFFLLVQFGRYAPEHIQTIIFIGLGLNSLFYVFSCRSLRKNIWQYNPFSNRFLNISVVAGLALLAIAVYLPPFTTLLRTAPLSLLDWTILVGLSLANILLIEIGKWYYIRKDQKTTA